VIFIGFPCRERAMEKSFAFALHPTPEKSPRGRKEQKTWPDHAGDRENIPRHPFALKASGALLQFIVKPDAANKF
jgi:hypothetical protein